MMFQTLPPFSISKAADLLKQAHRMVVLTGAGYSTPSGIPDFRSPNTGIWEKFDPMEVASLSTFRFYPQKFFDWFRPLVRFIQTAQPNSAHFSLAQLEKAGHFVSIITQNIDGLHQKAGSSQVFEVHGSISRLTCSHCYRQFSSESFFDAYLQEHTLPICPHCQHLLKPDIILYEEQLPLNTWKKAEQAAATCDVMVIAGTSLTVFPAASLPRRALENGVPLIIINQTPTYLDENAEVVIYGDIAEIIPHLIQEILND